MESVDMMVGGDRDRPPEGVRESWYVSVSGGQDHDRFELVSEEVRCLLCPHCSLCLQSPIIHPIWVSKHPPKIVYFTIQSEMSGFVSSIFANLSRQSDLIGRVGGEHPLRTLRLPDGRDRPFLPHLLEQILDEMAPLVLVQSIGSLVQQQVFNLRQRCVSRMGAWGIR